MYDVAQRGRQPGVQRPSLGLLDPLPPTRIDKKVMDGVGVKAVKLQLGPLRMFGLYSDMGAVQRYHQWVNR